MTYKALFLTVAGLAVVALPANSQTYYRRATLIGVSNPDEGRCTVSVMVDGAADVEIRGDHATLRNVTGLPPRFRSLGCTGRLPDSPSELRVRAVEGNGKLTLTHNSYDPGAATVRVVNFEGGDQLYTFDVMWRTRRPSTYDANSADRMVEEDTAQSCRTAVENRIRNDGYRYVRFSSTRTDDRGANDWVSGAATATRASGYDTFSFSCEVSPEDGQVRSLDVTRR